MKASRADKKYSADAITNMKSHLLSFTIILLALVSTHKTAATCSKTSAFRYEFEGWFRRYLLETIGNTTQGIENIYKIALSEIELEETQEIQFQKSLNMWQLFYNVKIAVPKHELEEVVKEFRAKFQHFEMDKNLLGSIATKNLMKALDEVENVAEEVSRKYAAEILEDWRKFSASQDFETLAHPQDCVLIKKLMDNTQDIDQKTIALSKMSSELFEIFGMQEWTNLLLTTVAK